MCKLYKFFLLILILIQVNELFAQNEEKTFKKYLTWSILQLIPSPVYLHDRNENNGRLQFGLRWNVIPLNISFNSNKYISPVQFFMINPVRRFTGSIELFVQPEWATAKYQFANLNRFGINTGARFIIPLKNEGEHLAMSLGGKYNYHTNKFDEEDGYFGVETGIYAIFGMIGLQFNYNFNADSKYNVGLYLKYF